MALLIKLDDVHDGLRILFLLRPGDAVLLEENLPLLRKTGEFASRGVEPDVCEMDGVVGSADLDTLVIHAEYLGPLALTALGCSSCGGCGDDVGGSGVTGKVAEGRWRRWTVWSRSHDGWL